MEQGQEPNGKEDHPHPTGSRQDMFQHLVEHSRDVIFRHMTSPAPRTVYVSPSCSELLGHSQSDFESDPGLLPSLFHDEDVVIFNGLLNGSVPYSEPAVIRMVSKDGDIRWTEHWVIPLTSDEGRIIGIDSFCRDITERMHESQALIVQGREIESLLQKTNNLIQSAPMAILELDPELRILSHNAQLIQYLASNWPQDGIVGKDFVSLFSANTHSLEEIIRSCCVRKKPAYNRFLPLTFSFDDTISKSVVYDVGVAPMMAPDRSLSSIIVMMRDISELGELDRERSSMTDLLWVMSSVETLQDLLDNSVRVMATSFNARIGMIFLMNNDFDRLFFESQYGIADDEPLPLPDNKGFELTSLFSSVESSGCWSIEEVLSPVMRELLESSGMTHVMWAKMTSGPEVIGYIVLLSTDRSSFDEQSQILFKIQANTLAYAIQRMQTFKEAERARGEAATYLDLMTHDIANYTTALMSFSEMIEDSADVADAVRKHAQDMRREIRVISALIDRLRKLTAVSQEPTSLVEVDLIPTIMDLIARQMEGLEDDRSISLEFDPPTPTAIALADPKVEEAIENILVNAVENTVTETIDINISLAESSRKGHGFWELVIEDHGTGIPDEIKANLLMPSKDYWEIKRGFGMGLFMSKMIVERSRGQILISDRVPGDWTLGTKVTIVLMRGG